MIEIRQTQTTLGSDLEVGRTLRYQDDNNNDHDENLELFPYNVLINITVSLCKVIKYTSSKILWDHCFGQSGISSKWLSSNRATGNTG